MCLISVIIPVYNTELYLRKCLCSVVNQTYRKLEIIVVDDGSSTSTALLCDQLAMLDDRIKVIHKENGGLSSARNVGLDSASGDYISFLDSDDYIALDFYESLLTCARKDVIGVSHFVRIDENGKIQKRFDPHIEGDTLSVKSYIRELLLHIGDVSVCTKLFSKEIISSVRFKEGILNEDLLFMFDIIAKVKSLSFTNKVGYYYFLRSDSISSKYGKAIEDMVGNSLKVKKYIEKDFPSLKKEADRFTMFQHMSYLLLVPKNLRNKNNLLYIDSLKYLRINFLRDALFNKYLTFKQKLIMLFLITTPCLAANMYQKKSLKR